MNTSAARKFRILFTIGVMTLFIFSMSDNFASNVRAQDIPTETSSPEPVVVEGDNIEEVNPYFSIEHMTLPDGTPVSAYIIKGPPAPLPEYETERAASMMPIINATVLPNFPSYNWVFGCSAVSGAMISAYYDRGTYTNMYAGPTNGGVMPVTDTSWPTWNDGFVTYPNNPLIASHQGVDGRATKGSIDDYWVKYGSTANDPYITGGWPQHTWGTAIGDYMKTSQSAYSNTDGSTTFYNYISSNSKLTCSYMLSQGIDDEDGTYGRKLFYEARGYTVTDCYNQNTDNNITGGFSLANFQAEINAGHPVLLNLAGHSIVGYGYNGSTIYIRDTWDNDQSHTYTMPWGGSYEGMELLSVSVVNLSSTTQSSRAFLPMVSKISPPIPLLNGDFELGPVSWEQYSSNGWDLILQSFSGDVTPYNGTWAVWLGGDYYETSYIQQSATVPLNNQYLSYYHWIASEDACGYDYGRVRVNGTLVEQYDLCTSTNTGGWVEKVVNLSAYAGSIVTIRIEASCDGSLNSNLFVDHVEFSSSLLSIDQLPSDFTDMDVFFLKQEVIGK